MDTYTPIQKQEQKKYFILHIWNSFINRTVPRCNKFFYHICHALCAILWGLYLFIDTYKEQKNYPVPKWTTRYASILNSYYGGIGFMIYGTMLILLYYNII